MDTISDEGWIKLHRKIISSQVFQSEGLLKIWVWCLLKANHEGRWVQIRTGKGTGEVHVERGQFIFGRKTASKELKMKQGTLYDRMQKLADMQNINIQTNTHYSIVTVYNYEPYQSNEKTEATANPTPNQQATNTNKNYKNEKNNNGRSKKQTDPRVKEFLDYWKEFFLRETGQPYVFAFGRDGNLIKNLLAVHDFPTLQDVTKTFFKDEQCKRRGLTIGIFFQEINRLLSRGSKQW